MELDGFDLHAALTIAAQHQHGRAPLEKLLRYCARPPIAQERLSALADGRVALQLKTPWHDGTTHVVYEPLDFVAKLAALIPRPHKNLVLYHGVLAANAAWRPRVVAYGRAQDAPAVPPAHPNTAAPGIPRHARWQWGELMRRAFGYDLLSCPNCGGKMKLVAVILERAAIRRILAHLRLPTEPPAVAPARASPEPDRPLTTPPRLDRGQAALPAMRPQKNLILYTGVLAPRSRLRARVRAYGRTNSRSATSSQACSRSASAASSKASGRPPERGSWARLMQRAFEIDVLVCPGCNGRMRLLALIEKRNVARRILRHLGMRDHPPPISPPHLDDAEHAGMMA